MVRKSHPAICSPSIGGEVGCCKVEALVSVDERGQMVLPKELRDRAGIQAGDKLAVVGMETEGRVCCISLIKVEEITEMVKSVLGPVMKDIFEASK
jgi:AbrB family looped-hinge helix DNA binding protein